MYKRIRLSSTDSANSVNKKNLLDVEMRQHTKMFTFQSISDTIDQRELFEKEREESTKYRLILTIYPYCTNVLFNAVTEIVKNEGSNVLNDLCISAKDGVWKANSQSALSKTHAEMIRNTEYTNDNYGYVYHCGYDIFNNHILRNQTFKLVNPLDNEKSFKHKNTSGSNRTTVQTNYNTISDMMRYADGTEVKLTRRTDVKTIEGVNKNEAQNDARHLYLKDDILPFIDSINANLTEQNGWWGFNNRSSIPSTEFDSLTKQWNDLYISKVINGSYIDGGEKKNHVSCEFIEMYPDSKLYSFNPNYNFLQNREEQNWDICLTYPYENDDSVDKILINGIVSPNECVNSLLLAKYKQTKGTSGQDIILFRSFVKHNLHVGDKFKLFYMIGSLSESNYTFTEIKDRFFEVINTGDLKGENLDYYFYINDVNDIKQILNIDENNIIPENSYTFRFVKVVNDRPCKYYYRKFKKLPNFKFVKKELTQEIVENRQYINGKENPSYNEDIDSFEEYIDNNCRKNHIANNEMLPFSKEQYKLAFSETVYGDDNTQVVFTDTIEIDKLTDNLGRPLTELFVTFIKRNKGHDVWYKKQKTQTELENIEFSHCFGKLVSGLDIYGEWSDNQTLKNLRKNLADCSLITNTEGVKLDDDIILENKEHDIFYGDVVEFNVNDMTETVLSDVHFRFNTEQREHIFGDNELQCNEFVFDEIETDDYDRDGFNCVENIIDDTTYRPEGYHYKAHYPIKVREFGSMRQSSHNEIKISKCKPRQAEGMFIEVVSSITNGVSSGDIIYLCDDSTEEMIPLTVNSVLSNVRFLLNPMVYNTENYKSVFDIVEGLLHSDEHTITQEDIDNGYTWMDEDGNFNIASGKIESEGDNPQTASESDIDRIVVDYSNPKYILRKRNLSIPSYAYKIAPNTYLWRDVLNVGNKDVVELKEYPFANGHFYINKEVNFFLRRQDPFRYNGLYAEKQVPNDIVGNVKKETNYEYKDEKHKVC